MSLDQARFFAVIVAVAVAVVLGLILAFSLLSRGRRFIEGAHEWFFLIVRCIVPFFSVFSIVYPVIELLFVRFLSVSEWSWYEIVSAELKSGLLPARISSILIGAQGLAASLDSTIFDREHGIEDNAKHYPEIVNLRTITIESIFRNRHAHLLLGVFQSGFYLWSMFVYWTATDQDPNSLWPTVLAFALFFVIGDWRIIFKFSLYLKGQIPPEPMRVIWITNALLFIFSALSLKVFSLTAWLGVMALGVAILFYSFYFSFGSPEALANHFSGTLDWRNWGKD